MRPHPLTNFEIRKNYQNEHKLNGVYSRNNLPKIKDGAYAINGVWWVRSNGYWFNRSSFDSLICQFI